MPSYPISEQSEPVFIKFENRTRKDMNVYWIDYEGNNIFFSTVVPDKGYTVKTFMRHVWVFTENNSSNTLLANGQLYFRPNNFSYIRSSIDEMFAVLITNRIVPNLQNICVRYMSKNVKCINVKYLEIPIVLKKKIIRRIHSYNPQLHDKEEKIKCETDLVQKQ